MGKAAVHGRTEDFFIQYGTHSFPGVPIQMLGIMPADQRTWRIFILRKLPAADLIIGTATLPGGLDIISTVMGNGNFTVAHLHGGAGPGAVGCQPPHGVRAVKEPLFPVLNVMQHGIYAVHRLIKGGGADNRYLGRE